MSQRLLVRGGTASAVRLGNCGRGTRKCFLGNRRRSRKQRPLAHAGSCCRVIGRRHVAPSLKRSASRSMDVRPALPAGGGSRDLGCGRRRRRAQSSVAALNGRRAPVCRKSVAAAVIRRRGDRSRAPYDGQELMAESPGIVLTLATEKCRPRPSPGGRS